MCIAHNCQVILFKIGIIIIVNFGVRFKKYRLQNGYTQKQIAELLGIHQSNVSDWENDITRPEYEHLIALAKIYDETIDSLLGNSDLQ